MILTNLAIEMKMGNTPIWCKMSKGDQQQATVQVIACLLDLKNQDPDLEHKRSEKKKQQKVQSVCLTNAKRKIMDLTSMIQFKNKKKNLIFN